MSTDNKKKYFYSMLFSVALIFLTFYYLFKKQDLWQVFSLLREASPLYLACGLLLMFIFMSSEALGIKILLSSFYSRPSFAKCLKYSFVSFYFCSITPGASGGQPAQIYFMKRDGIEIGSSSLCIMMVAVCYHISMLLIGFICFALKPGLIVSALGLSKYLVLLGVCLNLFLILIFANIVFHESFLPKIVYFITALAVNLHIIKNKDDFIGKLDVQLSEYRKAADFIKKNPLVLLKVLLCILIQLISRLSVTFVVYRSFGLTGTSYLDIISLQVMLALAVEVIPIPGSVGVAETAFLSINRLIFGSAQLLPAMLLSRGISYYAILLISGLVTLSAHLTENVNLLNKNPGRT